METEAATVPAGPPQSRREQREATRARLLQTAVAVLIERGVAGTTTLEVQQRAGVSRGALLHHFPTHAQLLSATVGELVRLNEAHIWREQARASDPDPLASAIRTLTAASANASYIAELELWAVARTDTQLRDALRTAERDALKENERVMAQLFAAVASRPGCSAVVSLTIEFVRGLALSDVLRTDPLKREQLVERWISAAKLMIDQPSKP
jgi:AcrR family transcriptional regulator